MKQIAVGLISKFKADHQFDKREALKFVVEVLKQSGKNAQNNLLGADAVFKELDKQKRGYLELSQITQFVIRVVNFGKSKKHIKKDQRQSS